MVVVKAMIKSFLSLWIELDLGLNHNKRIPTKGRVY